MKGNTMKRVTSIATIFLLSFLLISSSFAFAKNDWENLVKNADWQKFSQNLEEALTIKNVGLQTSAMQMIIKYGNKVDVDNSVLNLVRIYRMNKNEKIRQLALVTLHAMQNDWALGIIKRDFRFESSDKIKRMMAAIIANDTEKVAALTVEENLLVSLE
jgi:hypothetical protein